MADQEQNEEQKLDTEKKRKVHTKVSTNLSTQCVGYIRIPSYTSASHH